MDILTDHPAVRQAPPEIGGYKVHPAADLLPDPTAEEFTRLKDDITQHGVLIPVVMTDDGRILDGRSRVRACTELGIKYPTRPATADEALDPIATVLSMNAARRHLKPDQIAAIYLRANAPKVEADQKAAQAAQQAGLKKGKARGGHVNPTGKTAAKLAQSTGVSESTAKRVLKLKKLAPERLQEVVQGTVSAAALLKEEIPESNKGTATEATLGGKKTSTALSETTQETLYLTNLIGHLTEAIPEIKKTVKARRSVDRELHEQAVKAVEMLRETLVTIAPVWKCEECETVLDPGDEPESRYECGECGETLRESRCESCNKFAMKVSDAACPMEECNGEMVLVGWETAIDLIAAQAKKKEEEERAQTAKWLAEKEFAKTKAGKAEAAKKAAERKAEEAARTKVEEDRTIERARLIAKGRAEGKTTEQVKREEEKVARERRIAENKKRWQEEAGATEPESIEVADLQPTNLPSWVEAAS